MGWFDDVMNVANPVAWAANNAVTNGGASKAANNVFGNSSTTTQLTGSNASARQADLDAGYAKGKEIFYDDPDMQMLRQKREDLAKGYSGEELGAIRGTARGEIAGNRDNYLRTMSSNLARGGVGGARAAAVKGAADQKYNQNVVDSERKMAVDSANMVRQGTNDLQDYILRQKYGMLGTGLGYGELGVSDRAAQAAAAANQSGSKGILGNFLDSFGI